ncbi:MAG: tail fiber domain-containing protein [Elusimicrobiota bacterium]
MKKILLAIIVFIILPAFLYCAPDVTIKLETNNGSSTLNVTNSDDISVSSITSSGNAYYKGDINTTYGVRAATGVFTGAVTADSLTIANNISGLNVTGTNGLVTTYGVSAGTGVFSGAVTADRINVATVAATTSQGLRLVDDAGNLGFKIADGGQPEIGQGKTLSIPNIYGGALKFTYSAYPEALIQNTSNGKWTRFTESAGTNVMGIWNAINNASGVVISTYTVGVTPPVKGLWVQGNVGIGAGNYGATTSELEVAGRIEASSSMRAPQINALDANGLKLYDDATNGIFIKDGGNIGIGTTDPVFKLDMVTGDFALQMRRSNWTNSFFWLTSGLAGSESLSHRWYTIPILTEYSNGTSIFNQRLGVNVSSATLTGLDRFVVGGNILATNITGTNGLNTTYGVSAGTGVFTSTVTVFALDTGQGANELYDMDQNMKTTDNVQFNVLTSSAVKAASSNGLYLIDDANNGMIVRDGGNVGIGITNPGSKLEIRNDSTDFISHKFQTSGSGELQMLGWASGWNINALTTGKNLYINRDASSTSDLYLGRNTYELFIDGATGNVGIGTTNPSALLDLYKSTSGEYLRLSGGAAQTYMTFFNGATRQGYIGTGGSGNDTILNSDFNLTLQAGGVSNNGITIKSDGNVGIGTTDPDGKLRVNSSVRSNEAFIIDGPTAKMRMTTGSNATYIQSGTTETGGSTADLHFTGWFASGYHMTIKGSNGWVGIGTVSPGAPLHIDNGTSYSSTYDDYLIQDGVHNITAQSWSANISVRAAYGYFGSGFYTSSDKRIKNITGISNIKNDLDLINKLNVVDYKYIDFREQGNTPKKGFIAQDVEKVFPQAVSTTVGFVPNVYESSKKIQFNEKTGELTVKALKKHDFKEGDKVRIITRNGAKEEKVVKINDDTTFVVGNFTKKDLGKDDNVFVFGKHVNDFKTINYDEIYAAGISAIQELSKKMDEKDKEIQELKNENNNLKLENTAIKQENKEFSIRLSALEEKIK